jgi:carbon-monoxide dehydrogenase medium subunit
MTTILGDAQIRRWFPALLEAAAVVGSIQIRNRATLVGNVCNASPAADTVPVLLVHGAVVNVAGRSADRQVPLSEFFVGPGRTVLQDGRIRHLAGVPIPSGSTGAAFGRLIRRRGVDLAIVNLCVLLEAGRRLVSHSARLHQHRSRALTPPGPGRHAGLDQCCG